MKQQLRGRIRAMTLIEVMVVIAIIGLLASVMVSTVKYQYRNRSVKESERQLNAFIGAAQARAQQLGRPVGIWIERFSKEAPAPIVGANPTLNPILPVGANYAVQIYQAEVPRPYTGDLRDSRVTVSNNGTNWAINFPPASALLNPNNPLIRVGERFKIQFDHRGPFHEAVRVDQNPMVPGPVEYVLLIDTISTGGQIPKAAITGSGVPYTVHRRPVRSFLAPLRLPQGAVIDLSVSGIGPGGTEFNSALATAKRPVVVMFNSDGSVGDIYFDGKVDRPLGWIHFLVGRQEMVFPTNQLLETETEQANLMYNENRWVSINHRTGTVTSEVLANINNFVRMHPDPTSLTLADKVAASRELIRTGTGLEGD
ncbi:MAG: type II secretion system protein [Planctomycetaceae bacterium]